MELRARGIDPDSPDDRVTAEEWMDAHAAEQADADHNREIHDEYELTDEPDRGAEQLDDHRAVVEVTPADIRETSTLDPTERQDPTNRRRIVPVDETAQIIERAQTALAEVTARQEADAAREAEETARRDELARWSAHTGDSAEASADDGEAYHASAERGRAVVEA